MVVLDYHQVVPSMCGDGTCHLLLSEQSIACYHSSVQHQVHKQVLHGSDFIALVIYRYLLEYHTQSMADCTQQMNALSSLLATAPKALTIHSYCFQIAR